MTFQGQIDGEKLLDKAVSSEVKWSEVKCQTPTPKCMQETQVRK